MLRVSIFNTAEHCPVGWISFQDMVGHVTLLPFDFFRAATSKNPRGKTTRKK